MIVWQVYMCRTSIPECHFRGHILQGLSIVIIPSPIQDLYIQVIYTEQFIISLNPHRQGVITCFKISRNSHFSRSLRSIIRLCFTYSFAHLNVSVLTRRWSHLLEWYYARETGSQLEGHIYIYIYTYDRSLRVKCYRKEIKTA